MTHKQVREDVAVLRNLVHIAYNRLWQDLDRRKDMARLARLERQALKGVRKEKR